MTPPDGDVAISKSQRWLDLIAFLVTRHFPVAVEDIMLGVPAYRPKWTSGSESDKAAVQRMFERDKDELRGLGVPLETVPFSVGHEAEQTTGYQLAERDFYLPYLRIVGSQRTSGESPAPVRTTVEITGEEAATAIEALQRVAGLPGSPFAREARSALQKLGFDLDLAAVGESPVAYAQEDALLSPAAGAVHRDRFGTVDIREYVELLTGAVRRRARVRFRYHGIHRGEPTHRDVAPYGMLYQHGQWYVIGHDATRDDIRVFRLGRMEPPDVGKGTTPEYEIPADFRVSDYARREPWELGDDRPLAADVRFEFPLALWAERNRHGDLVERLAGGGQLRRFAVRQVDPFLRWLQQFGGDAEVRAPAELRDAQREMARETAGLYDRGEGGRGSEDVGREGDLG